MMPLVNSGESESLAVSGSVAGACQCTGLGFGHASNGSDFEGDQSRSVWYLVLLTRIASESLINLKLKRPGTALKLSQGPDEKESCD